MDLFSRVARIASVVFLILFSTYSIAEEQFRDYYAEPGLHPFKDSINQHFNEHIDPFGGTLQLSYIDLKIPGNGGLDINIYRTYTSRQENLGVHTTTGVGWEIHQGRIVVAFINEAKMCDQIGYQSISTDNPSLELPDGSRHTLFYYKDQAEAYLVTKNHWKAKCITPGNYYDGMIVTSPDGVEYYMTQRERILGGGDLVYYHATQIKDRHGNTINISYINQANEYVYIDQITASDGRSVQFTYVDQTSDDVRLDKIQANGQTWEYNYTHVENENLPYYNLTEVVRPDNTTWQYQYYGDIYSISGNGGAYSLETVTYPTGGTITYTYDLVDFDVSQGGWDIGTTVVASKVTGGREITSATWTFSYDPASTIGIDYDRTTVTAPDGKYIYEYYGYNSADIYNGTAWKIGLLRKKEIRTNSNQLLESEVNTWDKLLISNENYLQARDKVDAETYAPLLVQRVITRGGTSGTDYTTDYSNYDAYGNPGQVVESANTGILSPDTRTTTYTYLNDTNLWIIGKLEDESIAGIGTIDRTFNSNGDLASESKYGVATSYTYHPTGDVATVTDARTTVTRFNNYNRGIPQEEIHPVSVNTIDDIIINRTINATGTVADETDGEGNITSYAYDNLNRLTDIDYPGTYFASVQIAYTNDNPVGPNIHEFNLVTRGNYQEKTDLDDFGRPIKITRQDTGSGSSVSVDKTYDAFGRLTFQSYPNSTTQGTTYQYDALGRKTKVIHADNSQRTLTYLLSNRVRVDDERDNTTILSTTYHYQAFGQPDSKWLIKIVSPQNILTTIDRNKLGLVTRVWQGENGGSGYEKTYGYDSQYFLTSLTQPEIGTTTFGRDTVGNLTSRTIGSTTLANYSYDYQNRQTYQDYGDPNSLDVTVVYDKNSNVTNLKRGDGASALVKTLSYDENDNLTQESITYDGTSFSSPIRYTYTSLDHLDSITYPSGRVITYSPDALGRPTRADPYLTSVSYHPSGQVAQLQYANGQTTDITLDNRLRVDSIQTSGQNALVNLSYGYDNLGNILSIADAVEPGFDRNMTYDGVNRLITADGNWGTGSISYDALGNIQSKSIGGFALGYSYDGQNRLSSVSGSNTYSMVYDIQGNITDTGNYINVYDAAGNLAQTQVNTNSTTFRYDGNDRRVVELGSNNKYYVYSQADNLLGEYNTDTTLRREYIYLGSQQIAMVSNVPGLPGVISITTPDANGNYSVSWGAVTDTFTHYELKQDTTPACESGSLVYSGTNTSYAVTGQTDGSYYYCVRACNGNLCGDYRHSNSTCAVVGANSAPCVQSSLTIDGVINDEITLTWAPATTGTVTHYELYESQASDFSGATQVYSGSALTTTLSGKVNGIYYYRIRACNNTACSPYTTGGNAAIVAIPLPTTPASVTVPTSSPGDYTIDWAASTPVTRYEVEEADNAAFTGATQVYNGPATSLLLTGKAEGDYYYRVRACNYTMCSTYQAGSNVMLMRYPPSAPPVFNVPTANVPGTGEYTITWDAATGTVTHYELQEARQSDFSDARTVYSGPDLSILITGKIDDTYYYQVRACNGPSCTGYLTGSNPVVVTGSPILAALLVIINDLILN